MQSVLSAVLLLLFFSLLGLRVAMLRKRGVRVIVFGATDRSDFLLLPVFLALIYAVLAAAFNLPAPRPLTQPFWISPGIGWLGLALSAAALAALAAALYSFGNSFRVGIDEKRPDRLVTTGAFAMSRNPVYVCFLIFFSGLFLGNPNALLAAFTVLMALAIHRQILREEAFLTRRYGEAYSKYQKRVRRYL